jgi:hypothetical protein
MGTADQRSSWFRNSRPGRELSQPRREAGSSIPYSGVQTKEACNKDDNDHDADDVKNVHWVLRLRYARFQNEKGTRSIATLVPDGTFHRSLKLSASNSP